MRGHKEPIWSAKDLSLTLALWAACYPEQALALIKRLDKLYTDVLEAAKGKNADS